MLRRAGGRVRTAWARMNRGVARLSQNVRCVAARGLGPYIGNRPDPRASKPNTQVWHGARRPAKEL